MLARNKQAGSFLESHAPETETLTAVPLRDRQFGPYQILALLGTGGMGEVYRARDSKLGRDVALKSLPRAFASDPERLARFRREARTLASLNHLNIAMIYGLEEFDGATCLVLELVEGETLRGPLAIAKALDYADQIADGLEAAHDKRIVHRDLKPANIKVTPQGRVKVLDFGLAKAVWAGNETQDLSNLTPVGGLESQVGQILGTPPYMSPEQAGGKAVDQRTDIWAFGCVLYELLTGKRAFRGENLPETIAAVLEREPDWSALPAKTPAKVRRLLRRCLEKDAAHRLPDIRSAREQIGKIQRGFSRWQLVTVAAATVAILIVAAVVAVQTREQTASRPVELTRVTSEAGLTGYPALSPDGRMLAYASDRAGGILNIWVQQVGAGNAVRVTNGPADDTEPSFSPDGSMLAYRSQRDGGGIYVAPTLGGTERRIADRGRRPRFSPNGKSIAYWVGEIHQFSRNSIYVVPAAGGEPRPIAAKFFSAFDPLWSPDGRYLLFVGAEDEKKPVAERYDWWVTPVNGGPPVATGALALLGSKGVSPVWREPGDWQGNSILFAASTGQYASVLSTGTINQSSIWSVRIASNPWRIEGEPRQLTVATGVELQPSMAVAADGSARLALASATGATGNKDIWALPVRADEGSVTGELRRITATVVDNTYPSISRDGTKVVFASDRNHDIFVKDLRTGTETALTATEVNEFSPFLSADGASVLFYAFRPDRKPSFSFWVAPARGGVPRQVCGDCEGPLYGWSGDARKVIYRDIPQGQPGRVRVRDLESGRDNVIVEHPKYFVTAPRLSVDERWITFQTVITQSQRRIFVAPLRDWRAPPESGWISITDGRTPDRMPAWAPGRDLLYFLSERDGFRCFWAQRLDPATKRPLGDPFVVQHFHYARRSFSPDEFAGLHVSVGPSQIVFPMQQRTGNIWLAQIAAR